MLQLKNIRDAPAANVFWRYQPMPVSPLMEDTRPAMVKAEIFLQTSKLFSQKNKQKNCKVKLN